MKGSMAEKKVKVKDGKTTTSEENFAAQPKRAVTYQTIFNVLVVICFALFILTVALEYLKIRDNMIAHERDIQHLKDQISTSVLERRISKRQTSESTTAEPEPEPEGKPKPKPKEPSKPAGGKKKKKKPKAKAEACPAQCPPGKPGRPGRTGPQGIQGEMGKRRCLLASCRGRIFRGPGQPTPLPPPPSLLESKKKRQKEKEKKKDGSKRISDYFRTSRKQKLIRGPYGGAIFLSVPLSSPFRSPNHHPSDISGSAPDVVSFLGFSMTKTNWILLFEIDKERNLVNVSN
ncbi:uncharacterized protein LOC117112815 [Anneissia japonica]|uniref:uncharacterized protein LOC117112815 n=1 Tax=Anneissia japonica TaxID=1529436 RepID=UPI001425668F|nr:uncharacterized protein LOC117112815 [Anneissia japonica]